MSERLYKTNAGSYYTIWNDSSQDKPQKSEGLKTKNKREARSRLHTLEMLYNAGYHKPFDTVWHQNKRIKHYVYSGDLTKIDLAKGELKSGILFSEALQEYAKYKLDRRIWTSRTLKSKKSLIGSFDYNGSVSDLTENDIHKFLLRKEDSYRHNFMIAFNAFLNWCVKMNYIDNKIEYVVQTPTKKIPLLITNQELKEACYSVMNRKNIWKAFGWLILRFTGMRPMELMNLKTKFVDLSNNRILVGGDFKTKTNRQRFVDVCDELHSILKLLIDQNNEYILGVHGDKAQYTLYKTFKRVTGFKVYALKDTYGYWVLTKEGRKDFNLIYLRDQYGHSSFKSTEKYLKFAPKEEEVDSLHDFEWLSNFLDDCCVVLNEN